MKALREHFGFGAGSPANVEAVLNQLKSNEFFHAFRHGDAAPERWDRMRSTGHRLKEVLGFRYH